MIKKPAVGAGLKNDKAPVVTKTAVKPKVASTSKSTTPTTTTPKTPTSSQAPSGPKVQPKISSRLDPHKTSNPFTAKNKHKTTFGRVYDAGEIPCRIQHSTAKMYLQWNPEICEVDYEYLLPLAAEGIRETTHPYVVIARLAYKEMCLAEGAREKVVPIVPKLIPPIRMALQSTDPSIFDFALEAIELLATASGDAISEHLNVLLIPINKKCFDKKYADRIHNLLIHIEECAGPQVVKLIKAKVPTYRPVC
ncbi:gapvd1 [Acrasis kona]|uniref:Gapvd1 n=1 Tax=Acrasis kona TaxID=1008807 RepID=A0AAW2YS98_9EUKA